MNFSSDVKIIIKRRPPTLDLSRFDYNVINSKFKPKEKKRKPISKKTFRREKPKKVITTQSLLEGYEITEKETDKLIELVDLRSKDIKYSLGKEDEAVKIALARIFGGQKIEFTYPMYKKIFEMYLSLADKIGRRMGGLNGIT